MSKQLPVKRADMVCDYFDRNDYGDFTVSFKDFDLVEVTFTENITQEQESDRLEEIKEIIFAAFHRNEFYHAERSYKNYQVN